MPLIASTLWRWGRHAKVRVPSSPMDGRARQSTHCVPPSPRSLGSGLAKQIKAFRREAQQRAEDARVEAARNPQANATAQWGVARDAAHRAAEVTDNDLSAIELWSAAALNYRDAARAALPTGAPTSDLAALWTAEKRADALVQAERLASDPAVQRLVTDWQQQAQGMATKSKADALQAGATDVWPILYREARTLEQRATGERGVAAIRDWLDAADRFSRANEPAQAARTALDEARNLWERQQRTEALDALHKGNEAFPGHPGLQQLCSRSCEDGRAGGSER